MLAGGAPGQDQRRTRPGLAATASGGHPVDPPDRARDPLARDRNRHRRRGTRATGRCSSPSSTSGGRCCGCPARGSRNCWRATGSPPSRCASGPLAPHLHAFAGSRAVRGGRDATTASDLLLAVLALDELLHAHGEALKPELLPANDAGSVLRSCCADADALRDLVPTGRVFTGRPFLVAPKVGGEEENATRLSPAAERVMGAVRQRVSDGARFGTRLLVRELLDDEGGEVVKLLARQGADVERLRAGLQA
ncbi:hypothetical protein [Actinosynnema pretiosum]|uniref:Clp R domain-containing protein n=1 Tax=Actinosynnema pretiosum TaxID=42197 RepID=A0A290Z9D6_9PSEU|nr:hypothetical protein [Actinosynnema pretiosum]ATE55589.1 hypothetical protein CNX65_21745 [Actinosynnema pretiosum]